MVPIINRLSEKYSFYREINDERIKREKILLPVNKEGKIDFVFMSSFMQEVEADILKATLKVFKDRLNANENKMGENGKHLSFLTYSQYQQVSV